MELSAEAIIGLVTLFVTCSPLHFLCIAGLVDEMEVLREEV